MKKYFGLAQIAVMNVILQFEEKELESTPRTANKPRTSGSNSVGTSDTPNINRPSTSKNYEVSSSGPTLLLTTGGKTIRLPHTHP